MGRIKIKKAKIETMKNNVSPSCSDFKDVNNPLDNVLMTDYKYNVNKPEVLANSICNVKFEITFK